jgi:hypothetical protein
MEDETPDAEVRVVRELKDSLPDGIVVGSDVTGAKLGDGSSSSCRICVVGLGQDGFDSF